MNTSSLRESKTSTGPSLLYVGRIVDWKRVHVCIETVMALKKQGFKNTVLNLIGPVCFRGLLSKIKRIDKKELIRE